MKSWLRILAVAGLVGSTTAGSASAGFLPNLQGTSPSGGNTAFNYQLIFFDEGDTLRLDPYAGPIPPPPGQVTADAGSLVTIYDFDFGTVDPTAAGSVVVPTDFAFTTQFVGINADGTAPNDAAALTNVSFYYTGAPVLASTNFTGFSILSSISTTTSKPNNFTGQTTNISTDPVTPLGNIGDVVVAGVPEPASAILVGLGGLCGLAVFRRRRPRACG
jgi:hypothetical protein